MNSVWTSSADFLVGEFGDLIEHGQGQNGGGVNQ